MRSDSREALSDLALKKTLVYEGLFLFSAKLTKKANGSLNAKRPVWENLMPNDSPVTVDRRVYDLLITCCTERLLGHIAPPQFGIFRTHLEERFRDPRPLTSAEIDEFMAYAIKNDDRVLANSIADSLRRNSALTFDESIRFLERQYRYYANDMVRNFQKKISAIKNGSR